MAHSRISITNSTPEDRLNYYRSLLELLGRIEVDKNDPALMEHLKTIFELLIRLHPGEEFAIQHNAKNKN